MFSRTACLTLALTLPPVIAAAHPHVFIDAGLGLDYDDSGALTQVRVQWAYDDFYSLLIIEDLGLDPDGDGILTPDENAQLQGFDAEWEPGFDGRLFPTADGAPIMMQPGTDFVARYQDGRIISTHVRVLDKPVNGDLPLQIQVYDPEYYVQFSMPDAPEIKGRTDCHIDRKVGDHKAAADAYNRAVSDALADDSTAQAEMLNVDIGNAGADQVLVTCGAAQ
jgi:polyphosphate kinase